MALAEVGYDDVQVRLTPGGSIVLFPVPPGDVGWKAVSLARHASGEKNMCRSCRHRHRWDTYEGHLAARTACLADRPLVRDCGVTR